MTQPDHLSHFYRAATPEKRFLLKLMSAYIHRQAPPAFDEPINPCVLIESTYSLKIAPILFHMWEQYTAINDPIPASMMATLQTYADRVRRINRAQTLHMMQVLAVLSGAGIRALPFKGAALAIQAHGDLGLRDFGDHDLWLDPARVVAAKHLLLNDGYVLEDLPEHRHDLPLPKDAYHFKLVHPARQVHVELHWRTAWTSAGFAFNTHFETLWANAVMMPVLPRPVPTLAPEDALILLCIDSLKAVTVPMGRMVDIAMMIQKHPFLNWERLEEHARQIGAWQIVQCAVSAAHGLFIVAIPPALMTNSWGAKKLVADSLMDFRKAERPIRHLRSNWIFARSIQDRNSLIGGLLSTAQARQNLAILFMAYGLTLLYNVSPSPLKEHELVGRLKSTFTQPAFPKIQKGKS